MHKKETFFIFLIFSFVGWFCLSCGSSSTSEGGDVQEPDEEENSVPSNLGNLTQLTFQFETQTDSSTNDELDLQIIYPRSFTIPLYIKEDGLVSIRASEFPKMVLRLCRVSSSSASCDVPTDDVDFDVDLVLDACGSGRADTQCGTADPTVFFGLVKSDGFMLVNAVAIRVRLFAVSTSSDGYTAGSTDQGLLVLERVVVSVSTGSVTTGGLTAMGTLLENNTVKLVAGGLVPASMPKLGGANYLAILQGTFDVNPLSFLE